jgi:hypothetical protein
MIARLVGNILATLVCTFMHNVAHIFPPLFEAVVKYCCYATQEDNILCWSHDRQQCPSSGKIFHCVSFVEPVYPRHPDDSPPGYECIAVVDV